MFLLALMIIVLMLYKPNKCSTISYMQMKFNIE